MPYQIWTIMEHQGRSLKWLAARTGYAYSYVRAIRSGGPVSGEFKAKCAYAMDLPEDILFSLAECSASETLDVAS